MTTTIVSKYISQVVRIVQPTSSIIDDVVLLMSYVVALYLLMFVVMELVREASDVGINERERKRN